MHVKNWTADLVLNHTTPAQSSCGLEILREQEVTLASLLPRLSFLAVSCYLFFQTPTMFEARGEERENRKWQNKGCLTFGTIQFPQILYILGHSPWELRQCIVWKPRKYMERPETGIPAPTQWRSWLVLKFSTNDQAFRRSVEL